MLRLLGRITLVLCLDILGTRICFQAGARNQTGAAYFDRYAIVMTVFEAEGKVQERIAGGIVQDSASPYAAATKFTCLRCPVARSNE